MSDLHSSVRELTLLQESTYLILSSADLDTVLHQILLMVRNYFGVKNCAVFLVDPGTRELYCRAQTGYESTTERRFRIGHDGVIGWAAETRAPVYVADVSREPRYVCGDANVRSELAAPLMVRDELIGVLNIESHQPEYFTQDKIELFVLFSAQAAVALENARLYATERRRMRQIELLNLIARSATAAADVQEVLCTTADLIGDSFEGSDVAVLLRQDDGSLAAAAQAGERTAARTRFMPEECTALLQAARTHAWTQDAGADARLRCFNEGSEIVTALVSCGEVLGALVVSHPKVNFFTPDDVAIAQAVADVCATAIGNVQLSSRLRRVVDLDFLTGLYNHRYFHHAVGEEVRRAKRYRKPFSLFALDLRGFRQVNHDLGFDGGDEVLRRVGGMLQAQMRANDVLARYAGDQFTLLLPETDQQGIAAVETKIRQGLDGIHSAGGTLASAHYPADGASEDELMRVLLARLEEAKRAAGAGA